MLDHAVAAQRVDDETKAVASGLGGARRRRHGAIRGRCHHLPCEEEEIPPRDIVDRRTHRPGRVWLRHAEVRGAVPARRIVVVARRPTRKHTTEVTVVAVGQAERTQELRFEVAGKGLSRYTVEQHADENVACIVIAPRSPRLEPHRISRGECHECVRGHVLAPTVQPPRPNLCHAGNARGVIEQLPHAHLPPVWWQSADVAADRVVQIDTTGFHQAHDGSRRKLFCD